MRLPLTPEQAAQLTPHLRHGWTLLARVDRLAFDGTNGRTSGALSLVFVSVPAERLDAVRLAIAGQAAPTKRRAKA